MKALVTGDLGFVGNHMVEELKSRNWEVYGCDIKSGEDAITWFREDRFDDRYDLVVHCAYEVGGRAHIDGTNMALATNLLLDSAMFEWALKTYQGAVLYFSSSAAYPVAYQIDDYAMKLEENFIDLDDISSPDASYGWAKLTGERVARSFSEMGGRVHVVRPFSGYAQTQSLDYPFPSIVRRATRGDLSVWGPPGQTRDWIHVSDVVNGAVAVYEQDVREPINLCTGIGTEMGELMHLARRIFMGTSYESVYENVLYDDSKPTGVFYRVGDPTKFHQIYQPKISIEEGVRLAIASQKE